MGKTMRCRPGGISLRVGENATKEGQPEAPAVAWIAASASMPSLLAVHTACPVPSAFSGLCARLWPIRWVEVALPSSHLVAIRPFRWLLRLVVIHSISASP